VADVLSGKLLKPTELKARTNQARVEIHPTGITQYDSDGNSICDLPFVWNDKESGNSGRTLCIDGDAYDTVVAAAYRSGYVNGFTHGESGFVPRYSEADV
jgi:hypothetical protein